MTIVLDAILWALIGFCVLAWGSIVFCWLLFLVAWCKGWHRDDITPAEILDRLAARNTQGAKS